MTTTDTLYIGTRVRHRTYGEGTVTGFDRDGFAIVMFDKPFGLVSADHSYSLHPFTLTTREG